MNTSDVGFPLGQGVVDWTTRSGRSVRIRHITAADAPLLVDLFTRLSAETLWRRFGQVLTSLPLARVQQRAAELSDLDPLDADALIALHREEDTERIVAVARLAGATSDSAEFALLVRDDFQGEGLGAHIFDLLVQVALVRGLSTLTALVAAENSGMLKIIRRLGFPFSMKTSMGETEVLITLRPEQP